MSIAELQPSLHQKRQHISWHYPLSIHWRRTLGADKLLSKPLGWRMLQQMIDYGELEWYGFYWLIRITRILLLVIAPLLFIHFNFHQDIHHLLLDLLEENLTVQDTFLSFIESQLCLFLLISLLRVLNFHFFKEYLLTLS